MCMPTFLYQELQECLGSRAEEFDLLVWVTKRDAQRALEGDVTTDAVTWWREAFRAELAARGWTKPKKYRAANSAPPMTPIKSTAGITWPCPHDPPCVSTWYCGKRQLQEQKKLK
jgi:hypothetical protein